MFLPRFCAVLDVISSLLGVIKRAGYYTLIVFCYHMTVSIKGTVGLYTVHDCGFSCSFSLTLFRKKYEQLLCCMGVLYYICLCALVFLSKIRKEGSYT